MDKLFSRRPKLLIWLGIQLPVAAVVLFVPLLTRFGDDALLIARSHWVAVGGVTAAYLGTASWTAWKLARSEPFRLTELAGVAGVVFGGLFFFLIAWGAQFSRIAMLSAVAIAVLGLLAPLAASWPFRSLLFAGAVGVAVAPLITNQFGISAAPEVSDGLVHTANYALDLHTFSLPIAQATATGGGIDRFSDGYLTVNGDGNFFYFELPRPDSIDIRPLSIKAPINAAEFDADVAPDVDRSMFRTADLLVLPSDSGLRLLVSHLYWKRDESCYVVRVSELATTPQALLAATDTGAWRTVFEAQPCIYLRDPTARPWAFDKLSFVGVEMGGRLMDLGDGRVMMTTGDHQFDGWNSREIYAQDPGADYGKVVVFDPVTGASRHFSMGHRNPQGLTVDAAGRIWSTEHGPQGGDELNLLTDGANYGWPYTTYGAEYGEYEWPLQAPKTATAGFVPPRYAWVPSIGVSSLIALSDTVFPLWRGDLMVSSLKAQSLFRIGLEGDRPVFAEPIPMGVRVRDLVEGSGGIVILGDDNSIVLVTPALLDNRGAVVFGRCAGCHEVGEAASQRLGPNLSGVVGRDIASVVGFNYSRALRELEGSWNEDRLDRFLENPMAEVPGTTMAFPGIADPQQRAALIEYLATLR